MPEQTEGHEGFYHLLSFQGDVEETLLNYIIRDHDRELFEKRKETVRSVVKSLQQRIWRGTNCS